jgi:hypothetical protein
MSHPARFTYRCGFAARRRAGGARVTTPCHTAVTCLEQNIVEGVN